MLFLCFIIIIKTQNMTNYVEATVIDVADDTITDPDTVVIDVKEEIFKNNNYDYGFYISSSDSDIDSNDDDGLAAELEAELEAKLEALENEHNRDNMTEEEIDEFEKFIENKMICCIALIIVGLIAAVFVYTRSKY